MRILLQLGHLFAPEMFEPKEKEKERKTMFQPDTPLPYEGRGESVYDEKDVTNFKRPPIDISVDKVWAELTDRVLWLEENLGLVGKTKRYFYTESMTGFADPNAPAAGFDETKILISYISQSGVPDFLDFEASQVYREAHVALAEGQAQLGMQNVLILYPGYDNRMAGQTEYSPIGAGIPSMGYADFPDGTRAPRFYYHRPDPTGKPQAPTYSVAKDGNYVQEYIAATVRNPLAGSALAAAMQAGTAYTAKMYVPAWDRRR